MICSAFGRDGNGCGRILGERSIHIGDWTRSFEDTGNKSQLGPKSNRLMSSAFNLQTSVSGGRGSAARKMTMTMHQVEMNLSQMGKEERRTREGYKDQMKRKAFDLMGHTSAHLHISEAAVLLAKELFSDYRNVREHLNQFRAVVAACLIHGYRSTANMSSGLHSALPPEAGAPVGPVVPAAIAPPPKTFPCPNPKCERLFNNKRSLRLHETCKDGTPCARTASAPAAGIGEAAGSTGVSAHPRRKKVKYMNLKPREKR